MANDKRIQGIIGNKVVMKRVLVTGAAGFIGKSLVKQLSEMNYDIVALVSNNDVKKNLMLRDIDQRIEIVCGIDELKSRASMMKPFDIIFHLATVGVRPEFNNIEQMCDVNIKLGCQLLDFAKETKSKLLVNFGSCFEYGNHNGILLTEEMECYPESIYAIAKNASTNLMTAYAKQCEVHMITVRPFGVFGEGEGEQRLAPSIIKSCMEGKKVKTTAGEQIRDFVNVKDVVKAVIRLCESKYELYGIYNICSDNPVSVKSFINEIIETCKFDKELIQFGALPYRDNEAMVFAGSNEKLQRLINYDFPQNHKDGIKDIFMQLQGR